VNQAAGYVETEAQQPQNQNDHKDCPKHMFPFFKPGAPGRCVCRSARSTCKSNG
jgi:hypothetical protein